MLPHCLSHLLSVITSDIVGATPRLLQYPLPVTVSIATNNIFLLPLLKEYNGSCLTWKHRQGYDYFHYVWQPVIVWYEEYKSPTLEDCRPRWRCRWIHFASSHNQKRTTTNLKTKSNLNCQKIKLYGSPTTKELRKKYPLRLVGGVEMGSQD